MTIKRRGTTMYDVIVEAGNCVYCGRHIDSNDDLFLCKNCREKAKAIKALEADVPDTNVGEWIPVGERLPEKEDRYLCTVEIRSGNTSGLYIEICTYYKNLYTSEGFFKWEKGLKREENVIAWMPLPEPYMNGKEK